MKNSILRLLEYDKDELTLITEYHEMGNLNTFLKVCPEPELRAGKNYYSTKQLMFLLML